MEELFKIIAAGGDTALFVLIYHLWSQNNRITALEYHTFGGSKPKKPAV